jgi:glucose-6-phosphate 1-dehydrogenase
MGHFKKNMPTILVLMGATGDLVAKKIAPALFNLYLKRQLPKKFLIKGFARRALTDQAFRERVKNIILKHVKHKAPIVRLNSFLKLISYHQGEFNTDKDYHNLADILNKSDKKWKICANKLFYLSVPPSFVKNIVTKLAHTELTKPCSDKDGWSRVLVEKPFGKDLATARELDNLLGRLLKEEQIYRIDHYLAKEMIQNILTFRFSNNIFEKVWSNKFIESIEIKLWETLGVEKRGSFYDGLGTLRDVGQNHLLLMTSLLTMNDPQAFTPEQIREKREEILRTLKKHNNSDVKNLSYRAQHQGYKKIKGVSPSSKTETYFKLQTELTSPRWTGVPITMESGKRMGKVKKEAVITFKHPSPCLCKPGQAHQKNKVIFTLQPTEGIHIDFWTKKPGLDFEIEERDFDFVLRENEEKVQYTEEYEKLLLDAINGDQTLFLSTKEITNMWRFVDPIEAGWKRNLVPLKSYKVDTHRFAEKISFDGKMSGLKKEIGIVGLGKMGSKLVQNLQSNGWNVEAYNRSTSPLRTVDSPEELATKLQGPRIVWVMVPSGKAVDEVIFGKKGLVKCLKRGDIIIDGGNSWYKNSISRAKKLKKYGIHFVDVGVSGGPGAAANGACLMIGCSDKKIYKYLEPLFYDLSDDNSYQYFKGSGAGHFVKMVHNGIEYGMLQAIAEGMTILKKAKFNLDLRDVSRIYNDKSIIESHLMEWLHDAFTLRGINLNNVSGKVAQTGEGAWTAQTAKAMKLKVKIIEEAVKFRNLSQKNPSYTGKVIMAIREQFGGHSVKG